MSIVYQPAVRIVLGYAATAEAPPPTYAAPPTVALQKAVAKLGKDWKRVASMFVIAPAARSGRVAVGLAMARVPVVLDAARMVEPGSAIAKEHFIVQAGFRTAPDVDKYGNTQADAGILDALAAGASDPALAGLGLSVDDPEAGPGTFLVSDDGREGALVFGRVLWKPGRAYEGGRVRTFARDYEGGEGARLVGVPYASVGPDAPLARIDAGHPARQAHQQAATDEVKAIVDTTTAWGWYLVCDDRPGPAPAAEEPRPEAKKTPRSRRPRAAPSAPPPLAKDFARRPLASCLAALAALGDGRELAPQPVDLPRLERGYSHDDLSSPPERPPVAALYELGGEPDPAALEDPAKLLALAVPHEALGAWNATATGKWAAGEGWIVADLELVPEQQDEAFDSTVSAAVALFAIEGGWASAVWPGNQHEELARLLGFDPWARAEWRECRLWLGE